MSIDARQLVWQFFLARHFLREIIVGAVTFKRCFPDETTSFNAEVFLRNREWISATDFRHLHVLDALRARDGEM